MPAAHGGPRVPARSPAPGGGIGKPPPYPHSPTHSPAVYHGPPPPAFIHSGPPHHIIPHPPPRSPLPPLGPLRPPVSSASFSSFNVTLNANVGSDLPRQVSQPVIVQTPSQPIIVKETFVTQPLIVQASVTPRTIIVEETVVEKPVVIPAATPQPVVVMQNTARPFSYTQAPPPVVAYQSHPPPAASTVVVTTSAPAPGHAIIVEKRPGHCWMPHWLHCIITILFPPWIIVWILCVCLILIFCL